MKANTMYHVRGVVQFDDGSQFIDADQTSMTQALAAAQLPTITATGTAGMTPQNGVEMLNLVNLTTSTVLTALVTDLSGNVLWAYDPGTSVRAGSLVEPIKLLPNGHSFITFTVSTTGLASSSVLRAVDLAGTVIWKMTSTDLNSNFSSVSKLSKGRGLVEPHPLSL
jgi:arylsulfate sulfotransferase